MTRKYDCKGSLQQKILEGIDILADNVASTMGPKGRNVIIHQKGANPFITKDGVTVAKFVELQDPFQNAGAQIIKQASEQTNNIAGDGTTTATVLSRAILKHAQKYVTAGSSPVELKRGIDKAVAKVVSEITEVSRPITSERDVAHIATISANGDTTIGEMVATAVDKVGKNGSITIEEARSVESGLTVVEGFRFESGYLSPQFVTDERRRIVKYEDFLILVTDSKIDTVDDILPALELVAREGKPLLIVAEDVEGQALAALIMNAVRGTMKVVAVKAPKYGEERRNTLKDLALSVGATFMSRETGKTLRDITLADFGTAKTLEITKRTTTIVDGDGDYDEVEKRIETLKQEIHDTDSIQECEHIQERITRLASGVAIIHVGAPTEVEMIEKKHRLEDALEAVRSAQEEGVVPGGGSALVKVSKSLKADKDLNQDQIYGFEIVKLAIQEPARQMAKNAGLSPDIVLATIGDCEEDYGYDFSNDDICNMYDAGIIDPAKVTRVALQNAASVASSLILANFAIVETDS
jgi:chaperonin GroEL